MTTVAEGATSNLTLAARTKYAIVVAPSRIALVFVTRAGRVIYEKIMRNDHNIGPYEIDDVVTINAVRGDITYTASAAAADEIHLVVSPPGTGTFKLQSIDNVLTWTEEV